MVYPHESLRFHIGYNVGFGAFVRTDILFAVAFGGNIYNPIAEVGTRAFQDIQIGSLCVDFDVVDVLKPVPWKTVEEHFERINGDIDDFLDFTEMSFIIRKETGSSTVVVTDIKLHGRWLAHRT